MGKEYTPAQAAAHKRYMEGKTTIRVVIPERKAEEYKKAAATAGKSMSKFIIDCIEKELQESVTMKKYTEMTRNDNRD